MIRLKIAAVGALAIALAAAPFTPAFAGGYGSHHHGKRHYYYGNPLAPVVGLAAAVVGTAAAIVTLPFAVIGAAARAPYYYPSAPAPQNYYAPQANAAPEYAPRAYYPAPPQSQPYYAPQSQPYYAPQSQSYNAPPPPAPQRRLGQYGEFDGYRGPPPDYAANNGYYRQDGSSGRGYYAPAPGPYYAPRNGDYVSPNQR